MRGRRPTDAGVRNSGKDWLGSAAGGASGRAKQRSADREPALLAPATGRGVGVRGPKTSSCSVMGEDWED